MAEKFFSTRWRILKSAIFRNRIVCRRPYLRLKMCYFDKPSQISKYNQYYFRWGSTTDNGTIMVRHDHRKKLSLEVTIMVRPDHGAPRLWCAAIMVGRDHRKNDHGKSRSLIRSSIPNFWSSIISILGTNLFILHDFNRSSR